MLEERQLKTLVALCPLPGACILCMQAAEARTHLLFTLFKFLLHAALGPVGNVNTQKDYEKKESDKNRDKIIGFIN